MGQAYTLTVNGKALRASPGETLVNAGLAARILIPHDCCSGQCDTCLVRVVSGEIDDQGTADGGLVRACMATVEGDAEILFDEVPVPAKRQGTLAAIRPLSHEIAEVVVRLNSPFTYLPGQYVKAAFAGFPSRDYSPTAYLDGGLDETELVFHIKRYEGGVVSSALGNRIRVGHKVTINGPYGHAFFREEHSRLVLVASGTGWAPIWSVARAARLAQPEREMVVVAAARDPLNLYMGPAIDWLSANGVKDIVLTATGGEAEGIKFGRPTEYLPELTSADTVYAAGAPGMVDAVKVLARRAGADCYADPFTVSTQSLSVFDRLRQMMRAPSGEPAANPLSPRPAGAAPALASLAVAPSRAAALDRAAPGETRRRATLFSRILARS
ncbi:MAG TPA: FAD-binding oxidoreductase [Beijerinckiaceae bacterium]|jgi:3-phenylpropionate/trans-cinnamate dioxygenase ferredoxin reductase subunit